MARVYLRMVECVVEDRRGEKSAAMPQFQVTENGTQVSLCLGWVGWISLSPGHGRHDGRQYV